MSAPTRRTRRRWRVACSTVALTLGASLLAACGGGGSGGSASATDTLTIALPLKPQSLDPGKNGNGGQNIVQWLSYEPLIRLNSDGTFSPGLATEWGYVGEGNQAFEMTIRTEAEFADGTPVTAQSVVDTINHYVANPGPLSHFLTGVDGAEVKDEQTVAVNLSAPNPILPVVFSQSSNWGNVISPAGLANPEKLTSETFGAGAYVMDTAQTVDGDHYTFVPNENYWNPEAIHWEKVVVRVLPDTNAALQALQSGQVQVDMNTTAEVVEQARQAAGVEVAEGPGAVQAMFLMDRAGEVTEPLGDVRVRQALNHAVDRESIATALGGDYTPTAQIAPVGTDAHDESLESTYEYDPDRARELLADAGYADGFEIDALSISLFQTDTLAQAVASQLAEVGVTLNIKSEGADINQLISDMATREYAAVFFNAGTNMFTNALQNFASPASPLNPFASQGEEVMGAFDALAVAPEDEVEDAAVELNRAVVEQAWFVPLIQSSSYVFTRGLEDVGTVGNAGALDVLSWTPAS
ncbi:ABC transporter substrate-binding protein [Nocardioides sp. CPCC 205120]|uniref:ABC transporter substrate-binding protein n=1 Tax=Nocardioides sp. CPCC 205120 TaxID=3406462 RepID=UPI003B514AB6